MEVEYHELDPNGDVILILQVDESVIKKRRAEKQSASIPTEDSTPVSRNIRYRASSRHLKLSSSYFERSLRKGWPEGFALESKGSVEIKIENWDPEAFLLLLNIIHGRSGQVPRTIKLYNLANFAAVVDYYQCRETVQFFVDIWVDKLKESLPSGYSDDVMRWICVSWVFCRKDIFPIVTRVAQLHGKGVMDTLGLPIPSFIIGKQTTSLYKLRDTDRHVDEIRFARQCAIDRLVATVRSLFLDLQEDRRTTCKQSCNIVLLGALAKAMTTWGLLLNDQPAPQYSTYSYHGFCEHLRSVAPPKWYSERTEYPYNPHQCQVTPYLESTIASVDRFLTGFTIQNFSSESEREKVHTFVSGINART